MVLKIQFFCNTALQEEQQFRIKRIKETQMKEYYVHYIWMHHDFSKERNQTKKKKKKRKERTFLYCQMNIHILKTEV